MKTKVKFLFTALSITLFISSTVLYAEETFPDLTALELKDLIDSGKPLFLLNPLPSLLFRQGHIPGSVNIRWHAMKTSTKMPVDKNVTVVTYCMGAR